jgi:hypothetical protein
LRATNSSSSTARSTNIDSISIYYVKKIVLKTSPSVSASYAFLVFASLVEGVFVLFKFGDSLFDEIADLTLVFQETSVPNVCLEFALVHVGLPVLVYDLGKIHFLHLLTVLVV